MSFKMSYLPKGWVKTSIESIGLPSTPNIDPSKFPDEIFELYSVPSHATGQPEIIPSSAIHSVKQLVQPGDVLLCKIVPHINRVWIVPEVDKYRQIASGEWIVIRANLANSKYLFYALTEPSFRSAFMGTVSGVGGSLMRARPKAVAQILIPFPPIAEQKRIVTKLDSLFAHTRRAREELDHIPKLIERYKQAILSAAFRCDLTADWRKENNQPGTQNLTSIGDTALSISYGSSAKSSPTGSIPVLRMGNIQDGKLDWNDLVFTSNIDEIEKYKLLDGDVLFNRTNSPELVGKTAVYKNERPAIYAGYLIRIRCKSEIIPNYLNYCLNSPEGRNYCFQVK